MRQSSHAALVQPPHGLDYDDASTLIVLSTDGDDKLAQLRAGEAVSLILLAATHHGISTTPLSQPLEIAETRAEISAHLAGRGRYAQLLLRLGRPQPGARDLPASPRRNLRFVLEFVAYLITQVRAATAALAAATAADPPRRRFSHGSGNGHCPGQSGAGRVVLRDVQCSVVAFGAGLKVGQPAASGAGLDADAVVVHDEDKPGVDGDGDIG
jgi:hypothetical protein